MNLSELRAAITEPERLHSEAFEVVAALCARASQELAPQEEHELRDLTIRALEHRGALNGTQPILDSLVQRFGLYPYLDPADLDPSSLIAYEAHRPLDMPEEDVVFHSSQATVYRHLLD